MGDAMYLPCSYDIIIEVYQ